jgi:hypothetical protein
MKTELIRGKEQRLEEMTLVPAEAVRSIRNAAEDNNYGSVNEVF